MPKQRTKAGRIDSGADRPRREVRFNSGKVMSTPEYDDDRGLVAGKYESEFRKAHESSVRGLPRSTRIPDTDYQASIVKPTRGRGGK